MIEIEGLIKNTVTSCASMYGFSVEEALKRIDLNGNIIVMENEKAKDKKPKKSKISNDEKQTKKEQKALEKEQKAKEIALEKEQKALEKEQKAKEIALKKEQKALEKEQKAVEKEQKALKKEQKALEKEKKTIEVVLSKPNSEVEEEFYVRFQNVPLINEINSIRDLKNFKNYKKLSPGVKLARQILDI